MSRRCIGYEGKGNLRRPIWDTPLDPVPLPANPPGAIERRQLTEEELAAVRAAEPVRCRRSITHFPTPEDRQRAQASRMNGARRHVEVVAARKPPKEPPMPPRTPNTADVGVSIESSPLEDLAAAATAAHSAHEDKLVADAAWDEASRALTAAWRDLPAEFLDMGMPPFSPPTPAPDIVATEPSTNIPETIPGNQAPVVSSRITAHQRKVLEATIRLRGDRNAVAKELGLTGALNVEQALEQVGWKGELPIDLIALLPPRFAKFR